MERPGQHNLTTQVNGHLPNSTLGVDTKKSGSPTRLFNLKLDK